MAMRTVCVMEVRVEDWGRESDRSHGITCLSLPDMSAKKPGSEVHSCLFDECPVSKVRV
jgi:hypothetical protein